MGNCVEELSCPLVQFWRIRLRQPVPSFNDFRNPQIENLLREAFVRCSSALAVLPAIRHIGHPPNSAASVETAGHWALGGFRKVDSRTGKSPIKTDDNPLGAVPGAPIFEDTVVVGITEKVPLYGLETRKTRCLKTPINMPSLSRTKQRRLEISFWSV